MGNPGGSLGWCVQRSTQREREREREKGHREQRERRTREEGFSVGWNMWDHLACRSRASNCHGVSVLRPGGHCELYFRPAGSSTATLTSGRRSHRHSTSVLRGYPSPCFIHRISTPSPTHLSLSREREKERETERRGRRLSNDRAAVNTRRARNPKTNRWFQSSIVS